ncbi:type IV secretion protein DotU [Erwinia sp. OLTSP20]|uniref:DotU family type IV/VI secretion system protein n=1 Tax=unclassified Erwinia TaxID=2622719 RepID=UPI000C18BF60|nr:MULTISPECIES: DotU family type IV/VI secretion system protein [unclassified Erwinia]PIJ48251.1 type IV secretion protein DotU [Erwinia sp. OAMSP11]PIJ68751.1 type IV secretion protein DotU [Erwinia sp. OLSSP12]PIJ78926.1 type IV secretion protein DotU [Erwinia sp. OLCASP19]PIJ79536.1 type IV secretion protein DotU [Erwinia sp. OLMTSP26]PIJ81494.1 type IV secretion protein DotU [Erwinia sp. OLMDSP33]
MTLLDSYIPVFKQVIQITGDPQRFSEYEASRQTCITLFEQASESASKLPVSKAEISAASMAVIAWLDEMILCSTLPWRKRWQGEPLQRKFLNTTLAGEKFFTLMAQLDPPHHQAREVFLFCLQQGFHGQYATLEDRPALQALIEEQRRLCLPEAWLYWPNEALIIPELPVPVQSVTQRLRPILTMLFAVVVTYAALYFSLNDYVS